MHTSITWAISFLLFFSHAPGADAIDSAGVRADDGPERETSALPLLFVENAGQFAKAVRFHIRGRDRQFFFADDGVTIVVHTRMQSRCKRRFIA